MRNPSPDPYDVLHLDPAATAGDVARAYRALMRTHHPDTTPPEAVPAERESRAQELQEIMAAYTVLGDPVKRAAHDRQRQRPSLPALGAPPRPHDSSGAALIIGPVRWESPSAPGHRPAASGQRPAAHRIRPLDPDRGKNRSASRPRPVPVSLVDPPMNPTRRCPSRPHRYHPDWKGNCHERLAPLR